MNFGDRKGPSDAVVKHFEHPVGHGFECQQPPLNPECCSAANFALNNHSKNANGSLSLLSGQTGRLTLRKCIAEAHFVILLYGGTVVIQHSHTQLPSQRQHCILLTNCQHSPQMSEWTLHWEDKRVTENFTLDTVFYFTEVRYIPLQLLLNHPVQVFDFSIIPSPSLSPPLFSVAQHNP